MYELVIMAPGQGVQRPGMLDAWLGASPRAAGLVSEWSDVLGLDVVAASRDERSLADTSVAQPLIVAAALLSMDRWRSRVDMDPDRLLFAGHSVGELAAAVGAGYLTPTTAMALARVRGAAMSAACSTARTGMAAVMPAKRAGANDDVIEAAIRRAGLTLANWNGSHQFVAAGAAEQLEAFADSSPEGMRVAPLDVAGAFHTAAMAAAVAPFEQAVRQATFGRPSSALLSNRDGLVVAGIEDLRQRLVAQITAPVRWDRCAEQIAALGTPDTVHVELAPAGPLTRLTERAQPTARTIALRAPEDVDLLHAQLVASGG